jgi:hypothetical protein
MAKWLVALAIIAAGLCACSGTSLPDRGASAVSLPPESHANVGTGRGRLRLVLPPIANFRAPIPWASSPAWLSSATQAAQFIVNGKVHGVVLSAASPDCVTSPSGLMCTFSARVPAGSNVPISVRTYASANFGGRPLAQGALVQNIYANQTTTYDVPMSGIARRIGVLTQDRTFTLGQATAEPIIAVGFDASKRVIPSTNVVDSKGNALPPFTVTYSGFANGTLSENYGQTTTFACCGILPSTFAYDGQHTGTETFDAAAAGFNSKLAKVKVTDGNTTLATIVASTGDVVSGGLPFIIAQFPSDANGNVAPTRAFVPSGGYSVYGEDGQGNFWSGQTHYSNTDEVLGTLNLPDTQTPRARDASGNIYAVANNPPACSVFEYAGTYGAAVPLRQVDFTCTASEAMGVDAGGDIYVSLDNYSGLASSIEEFAAGGGSGDIAPTRVIPMPTAPSLPYNQTMGIDADAAGNVYVAFQNLAVGPIYANNIYEIVPGSTTPALLIPNVPAESLAVDDAGDVYVRTYVAGTLNALQVYPVGSTTPTQTISGSATRLYYEGPITVPRSWTVSPSLRKGDR